MDTFNQRLIYIRKKNNLTQKEMADRLKLSQSHVANLEANKREPSDIIINAICTEFSTNANWLQKGEGSPSFDPSVALTRTFAHYFVEISKAFSPVCAGYGEIMPLFESQDITRMYNYIAYKVQRGGLTAKNLHALTQTFDAAFPGYETVIKELESKNASAKQGMESSPIAQTVNPYTASQAKTIRRPHRAKGTHGEKPVEGSTAPINAIAAQETRISVPAKYLSSRYFIVQAQGDSMIGANINDGDYCVFQKDGCFVDGSIMLVKIDGSADVPDVTIKRVYKHADHIALHSENEKYEPMTYPPGSVQLSGILADVISLDA